MEMPEDRFGDGDECQQDGQRPDGNELQQAGESGLPKFAQAFFDLVAQFLEPREEFIAVKGSFLRGGLAADEPFELAADMKRAAGPLFQVMEGWLVSASF